MTFCDFKKPFSSLAHDPLSRKALFAENTVIVLTAVWTHVFWCRFWKIVFLSAKDPWEKPSQSIGQQRIQPAKKPGKVQQKIDTNFKTTTQKRGGAL